MFDTIKPHCDFDNIETYFNSPMDPPEGEMRVLSVYFPVKTTDEEIKKAMKPITDPDDSSKHCGECNHHLELEHDRDDCECGCHGEDYI